MALTVEIFHRKSEFAILDDGSQIPIVHWIDDDGDFCGAFDNPVSAVAGPDGGGNWHTLDLSEFTPAQQH